MIYPVRFEVLASTGRGGEAKGGHLWPRLFVFVPKVAEGTNIYQGTFKKRSRFIDREGEKVNDQLCTHRSNGGEGEGTTPAAKAVFFVSKAAEGTNVNIKSLKVDLDGEMVDDQIKVCGVRGTSTS